MKSTQVCECTNAPLAIAMLGAESRKPLNKLGRCDVRLRDIRVSETHSLSRSSPNPKRSKHKVASGRQRGSPGGLSIETSECFTLRCRIVAAKNSLGKLVLLSFAIDAHRSAALIAKDESWFC